MKFPTNEEEQPQAKPENKYLGFIAGEYDFKIVSQVERLKSRGNAFSTGREGVVVNLSVESTAGQIDVSDNLIALPQCAWKYASLCKAVGLPSDADSTELVGKLGTAYFEWDDNRKEPFVKKYLPPKTNQELPF